MLQKEIQQVKVIDTEAGVISLLNKYHGELKLQYNQTSPTHKCHFDHFKPEQVYNYLTDYYNVEIDYSLFLRATESFCADGTIVLPVQYRD